MKYNATIHTMNITPTINGMIPTHAEATKWIQHVHSVNHPCINQMRKDAYNGEPRLIINPHKLFTDEEGKFVFVHRSLKEIKEILNQIVNDLDADGYILRRVDICLDTDVPYSETEKFIRYVMLLLSGELGLMNQVQGFDPITFDGKDTVMHNGTFKNDSTIQISHYNRALLDQSNWAEPHIVNRLELRLAGAQVGKGCDLESVVDKWFQRINALKKVNPERIEQKVNDGLLEKWERFYAQAAIADGTSPKSLFNAFVRVNHENIYSRRQLKDLYRMSGSRNAVNDVQNLLNRSGSLFSLYKDKDIRSGIQPILTALERFRDGESSLNLYPLKESNSIDLEGLF